MGVLSTWSRKELEDNIVSLMVLLQEVFDPQTDYENARFVNLLNEIEGEEGHLLKDLAREIWTRENCASDDEWTELKGRLGL